MNLKKPAVFLTVGTVAQKSLCERLLADLNEKHNLNIAVVADEENGGRLGSGGALLQLLVGQGCDAQKMLVINCGGFSKRAVNYSLRGKAFANVLSDGEAQSLLSLLLENALRLTDRFSTGLLVCCSDILVDTKNLQLAFDNNIGFCVRADLQTASRHGVMFSDANGLLAEYPHKCSEAVLCATAAKYNTDAVLADTGLIYFTNEVCTALREAVQTYNITQTLVHQKQELNLYADIVALFAQKEKENPAAGELQAALQEALQPFTMQVCEVQGQAFMHFGSLRESLENILLLSDKKNTSLLLFSSTDASCTIGKNTVLDNVILTDGCIIGDNCLISDITLENISVASDTALCGFRLTDGSFVAALCPLSENPKTQINGTSLWDMPRFYKGKSFSASLQKLYSNADEEKYSLAYITQHADCDYFLSRQRYMKDRQKYSVNAQYLQKREQLVQAYFANKKPLAVLHCRQPYARVALPVRVNFSGTWTDAMPYCIDHGGQVINMAVTVNGQKPVCVEACRLDEKKIEFYSDNSYMQYMFADGVNDEDLSDFNLHIAVLQVMGITAKTDMQCGFSLKTMVSGIDKGSGLGTSSILLCGCIQALSQLFGIAYTDSEILQMVFIAEQLMNTGGGWQDQVGGLFPSVKISTTAAGMRQQVCVQDLALPDSFRQMFAERLVLIPTGQRHFGRFIVNDVVNRYLAGEADSLCAHTEIRALNADVLTSIKTGNTEAFLHCLNRHFEILKRISPLVTDAKIDRLSAFCLRNFADAVSICGAGGGGYLLAVLKDGISLDAVQKQIRQAFPDIASDVKKADLFE